MSRDNSLFIIAGPCVVESKEMAFEVAEKVSAICKSLGLRYIFKASYKKANRTSHNSFTGIGDKAALEIIAEVGEKVGVETLTDVHTATEATEAAKFVDIIQIPAFLSRQTDILEAAGKTGKTVNIKKGQFMAPDDIKKAAMKLEMTGNNKIWLTERGVSFGYHDLVVDFRSILIMKQYGYPVIYDATHSLQKPSIGNESGGAPEFIPALARAAVAVGCEGIFFETHPSPKDAKSDAATQLPLGQAEEFVNSLLRIWNAMKL